jgi:hypothetical protein
MSEQITKTVSEDGKTTTTRLDGQVVSIATVVDPVHVVIGGKGDCQLPKTK